MHSIIGIILWLLFIAIETGRNWYIIEKRQSRPVYMQSFVFRGWMAIVHAIYFDVEPHTYLPVLLFQLTTFWLLFDVSLNLVRKKPWDHTGAASGWIDRYIGGTIFYWILKAVALVAAVYYSIYLVNNY